MGDKERELAAIAAATKALEEGSGQPEFMFCIGRWWRIRWFDKKIAQITDSNLEKRGVVQ